MTSELRPCCEKPDIELVICDATYTAWLACGNCAYESDPQDVDIENFPDLLQIYNRSLEQTP